MFANALCSCAVPACIEWIYFLCGDVTAGNAR